MNITVTAVSYSRNIKASNQVNTRRQERVCRTQQISDKEMQNRIEEKKKGIIQETLAARKEPRQIDKHRKEHKLRILRKES